MLANLAQFRQSAYELLNFAQDSTFELMDAILTTKNLHSFPELSFSPLFRRRWSYGTFTKDDLPLNIGIVLPSKDYIGHYQSYLLPNNAKDGVI